MTYFYFDLKHAVQAHDFIIDNSGGNHGIINEGLIDSVIQHIRNDVYYPNIEDKVSHILFSIIKNHAFNDGNKRTSIALGAYFLEINGFDFKVSHFIREMENIVVHVADNKINKDLLYDIIVSILYENEYDESLQINIFNALNFIEPPQNEDENIF